MKSEQEDVHAEQVGGELAAPRVEEQEVFLLPGESEPRAQAEHDGERHGGSGEGDDQLLPRLLGQSLEARQAADGREQDFGRADAVTTRGEDVTEFVQQNAEEHEQHEHRGRHRRGAVHRRTRR